MIISAVYRAMVILGKEISELMQAQLEAPSVGLEAMVQRGRYKPEVDESVRWSPRTCDARPLTQDT